MSVSSHLNPECSCQVNREEKEKHFVILMGITSEGAGVELATLMGTVINNNQTRIDIGTWSWSVAMISSLCSTIFF